MEDLIKKAARDIRDAKHTVALTGAGISVESAIPPFRGKGGVWEKFDPMEYAHINAFLQNPVKVWRDFLKDLSGVIEKAVPNDAHKGLAQLERLGLLRTIITQNVDGLHQRAGSRDVIEFHGNFAWLHCMECRRRYAAAAVDFESIPPTCECGGILRPECVFFGEMIPIHHLARSREVAAHCDVILVIGTSAVVQPAASIPETAKFSGAKVIEINPEKTPLTRHVSDYLILGKAAETVRRIVVEVEQMLK
jgi:NAD-dependent deacetylase